MSNEKNVTADTKDDSADEPENSGNKSFDNTEKMDNPKPYNDIYTKTTTALMKNFQVNTILYIRIFIYLFVFLIKRVLIHNFAGWDIEPEEWANIP